MAAFTALRGASHPANRAMQAIVLAGAYQEGVSSRLKTWEERRSVRGRAASTQEGRSSADNRTAHASVETHPERTPRRQNVVTELTGE
jgi:hypothetical protein